jgi:hypothetical protein
VVAAFLGGQSQRHRFDDFIRVAAWAENEGRQVAPAATPPPLAVTAGGQLTIAERERR